MERSTLQDQPAGSRKRRLVSLWAPFRVRLDALDLEFQVIDCPGHTAGHIAYYGHGCLFCGDTLFSAGCGRLFEGTAEQMNASLHRLEYVHDMLMVGAFNATPHLDAPDRAHARTFI